MINFSITNPNGYVLNKTISNNDLLLSFGGGNFDISYGDNEDLGYGSFTFIADEDFIAWVELWGADGAAYGVDKMKDASGIGGHTKSLINFKKDIHYTITAGQAGYFRNKNTHGGGGSGYMMGGQGGGLSGLFINTEYYGKNEWTDHNCPVIRENVLLIAGGGGGKGGGNDVKKSKAGNGGGWVGTGANNSSPSTQDIENSSLIGSNGLNSGNNGGGGGGWVGGKSNTNARIKDVGGSGGSGHIVHKEEYGEQPNNNLNDHIIAGITKFGDFSRQDIYKKAIDKSKFSIVSGSRDAVKNMYKNIYMPQHGRFIIQLSNEDFDDAYYLREINPSGILG